MGHGAPHTQNTRVMPGALVPTPSPLPPIRCPQLPGRPTRTGMRPRFLSQNTAQKLALKNMPSTHANASRRCANGAPPQAQRSAHCAFAAMTGTVWMARSSEARSAVSRTYASSSSEYISGHGGGRCRRGEGWACGTGGSTPPSSPNRDGPEHGRHGRPCAQTVMGRALASCARTVTMPRPPRTAVYVLDGDLEAVERAHLGHLHLCGARRSRPRATWRVGRARRKLMGELPP